MSAKPQKRYALLALLAVVALGAAATATAAPGPPLTGQTLAGTAATTGICTGPTPTYTFSSSGSAAGAYAGSYTETGSFTIDAGNEVTTQFDASFTIHAVDGSVVEGRLASVLASNDGFCQSGLHAYGTAYATVGYDAGITLPNGTTCSDQGTVQVRVDGGQDVTEESFTSSGPLDCKNTPIGSNVVVTPEDLVTGLTPATVTYAAVTAAGLTELTTTSTGPAVPAGFSAGTPALYYDISTTAVYVPPVTVCLSYAGVTFASGTPQLFHYEAGAWVDATVSVDPVAEIVCGTVSTLSPFAVFSGPPRPQGAEQQLAALAALVDSFNVGKPAAKKFDHRLDKASAAFADGKTAKVCHELTDFERNVLKERGRTLTAAEAAQLTAATLSLEQLLGC